MRVLILFACALAACSFDPPLGDGDLACGEGGRCPAGYACARDGRCHLPTGSGGGDVDLALPGDGRSEPIEPPDLAGDAAPVMSTCGASGEPCCAGDSCASAGCCAASVCFATGSDVASAEVCLDRAVEACGAPGQPCCEDNSCAANGCCSGGVCAASGSACLGGGTCMLGSCGSCGGAGKACCHGDANGGATNDYCTQAGTACDPATNTCKACGAPGQLCCDGNRCDADGCCDHSHAVGGGCIAVGAFAGDGTLCTGGVAGGGGCGGAGQPACGNKVGCTDAETRDVNELCVSCGVAGQPCCFGVKHGYCAPPFACNLNTGLCAACGGNGEPCCVGAQCPGSTMHTCNAGFCH